MYLFSNTTKRFFNRFLIRYSQLSSRNIALNYAFVIFVFSLFELTVGHNWGDDHAQYIAQARAIATGTISSWLEKSIYTYSTSTTSGLGTVVYPWGEPLLLAPLYKLFGLNYFVFKLEGIIFLAASIFVLYYIFLELTSKKNAFLLTFFCTINTGYITYANEIYADYPCLFFTFLAILFILKYLKERTLSYGIGIGIFVFCAVSCRSLAFSTLAALGCMDLLYAYHVIFHHDYKSMGDFWKKVFVAIIPYVVFVILYLLLKAVLPSGDGYGSLFTTDLKTILWLITRNGVILTEFFGNFNSLYEPGEIGLVLFVGIFLIVCAIGMWKRFKMDGYLVFYCVINALVLFVFNGLQGHRYLLPLFPFLLYFAYQMVGERTFVKGILISLMIFMILYNFYHIYLVRFHKIPLDEATSPRSMEMYEFVKENVKEGEGVYFMKPRALYLNTDVNAMIGDEETIEEVANRVDYMVLYQDRSDYTFFYDYCVNQEYPLIFNNDWFEIYRVEK